MWQQPIALFPPPVPGALAWRKRRCKEASQTCKTFMVGWWSAWKVSHGEWEWWRVSQTRLISVRKSEPNQIVVYNLDRKNRTEIPARENTGTVQLSDPSEPVRSSPGSWPPDSGDAYKNGLTLGFNTWVWFNASKFLHIQSSEMLMFNVVVAS